MLCLPVCACAQTIRNVPSAAYPTIQAGINAANPGDTVLVAPSAYNENIDFLGKAITVTNSGNLGTSSINGSAGGPVVTIQGASATGAVLSGFEIENGGKPQSTGGPYGGIYIANASPTILGNDITGNFCAGIVSISGNPIIKSNAISHTQTTGCPAAEGLGSGIVLTGSNTTAATPGGIPAPLLELNDIGNNTASVLYAADKGGGGAINITNASAVYIELNDLSNNTSTGYGGAMYVATTPSIYFVGNLVYGNKGISGGLDIVVPGSSVGPLAGLLANNTIADNTATASTGGSDIYIGGNLAQYALVNNIIVGDVAGEIALDCGTTYANQTITPLVLDHNDIYSAVGTAIGGACTSPAGQNGNISVDPQFVNGTTDFQLKSSGAPPVDAGNNSVFLLLATDLNGNPRVQDATSLKYPVVDMGAYEFSGLQDAAPTVIQLSPSTYTPTTGGSLTLNATLTSTAGVPTGTVSFQEDFATVGTGIITSSGTATYTLTNLTAGLHTFVAVYAGQGVFTPATSVNLLLNATTPNGATTNTALVSSSPNNTSYLGQPVTFTATVSTGSGIIPTGQVEFSSGSTTLGIEPLSTSGTAALTTSTLPVGSLTITAAFVPAGTFNGSAASLTQVVLGAGSVSTLAVTPATAAYGSPIGATATVAPAVLPGSTPTGTVTFLVDGAISGSATLTSGVASVSYSNLPAGTHTFGCTYEGDATYAASTCNTATATVTAGAATLTLSSAINPSPSETPVTFTATLLSGTAPVPGATITFALTANPNSGISYMSGTAVTNAQGVATYIFPGAYPGTYPFTAIYAGSASLLAIDSAVFYETFVPNPTTMTMTATPNPANQGSAVTLSATVLASTGTAPPAGSVTFFDGGASVATLPQLSASGTTSFGSVSVSTLSPGAHTLTAAYTPFTVPNITPAFLPSQTATGVSVVILPSSFTFTPAAPSITIETQHHASLGLTVTSIGGFSGPINLACGAALPPVVTCELAPQVNLPANGSVGTTLTLDTDAVLDFKSSAEPGRRHGPRSGWISVAALVPLMLLSFRRRRSRLHWFMFAGIVLAGLMTVTGCSGKYPASTPPGTYTIVLTATGTPAGGTSATTQTIDLTLIVTP